MIDCPPVHFLKWLLSWSSLSRLDSEALMLNRRLSMSAETLATQRFWIPRERYDFCGKGLANNLVAFFLLESLSLLLGDFFTDGLEVLLVFRDISRGVLGDLSLGDFGDLTRFGDFDLALSVFGDLDLALGAF